MRHKARLVPSQALADTEECGPRGDLYLTAEPNAGGPCLLNPGKGPFGAEVTHSERRGEEEEEAPPIPQRPAGSSDGSLTPRRLLPRSLDGTWTIPVLVRWALRFCVVDAGTIEFRKLRHLQYNEPAGMTRLKGIEERGHAPSHAHPACSFFWPLTLKARRVPRPRPGLPRQDSRPAPLPPGSHQAPQQTPPPQKPPS